MTEFKIGEISFQCDHCGSADLSVTDDAAKGQVIACNSCGQTLATLAEAKAQAAALGRASMPDITRAARRSFKGTKGFKPH